MTKINKRYIMKPVRTVCLIAVVIVLLSTIACADFNWENNITVSNDGMTWEYTEQYTDDKFVFYKSYIDTDIGNDDGYVSAWELFKVDSITRDTFYNSIINDMDVKINNSSTSIHLSEIDSSISEDVLGKVYERGEATNYYKVMYSFDRSLTELGTNIWFLAEPETNITITFPAGIDVTSTEGIENTTTTIDNRTATLIGTIGFEGKITIGYTENVTLKISAPEPDNNVTLMIPAPEPDNNVTSIPDALEETSEPRVLYNPIYEFLKWLNFGPKR